MKNIWAPATQGTSRKKETFLHWLYSWVDFWKIGWKIYKYFLQIIDFCPSRLGLIYEEKKKGVKSPAPTVPFIRTWQACKNVEEAKSRMLVVRAIIS